MNNKMEIGEENGFINLPVDFFWEAEEVRFRNLKTGEITTELVYNLTDQMNLALYRFLEKKMPVFFKTATPEQKADKVRHLIALRIRNARETKKTIFHELHSDMECPKHYSVVRFERSETKC